jgi:hypothetical protein
MGTRQQESKQSRGQSGFVVLKAADGLDVLMQHVNALMVTAPGKLIA